MVGIALVGFLGLAWPGLSDLFNSKYFFSSLLIIVLAGVFAAIGHWADFEAIKRGKVGDVHQFINNFLTKIVLPQFKWLKVNNLNAKIS